MKAIFAQSKAVKGVILGIGLLLASGHAQAADCLDNRAIQDAIASGQIAPVDVVLAQNGVASDEQVLSVKVCDQGDGLVYVVAVLGPDGDARNLVLPAS